MMNDQPEKPAVDDGIPLKKDHQEDKAENNASSGMTQILALIHKNCLTKVRTPGATLAEFASPVLLMIVLWVSYNLSDVLTFPSKQYHALNVDLPLFWSTGAYAEEELDDFDYSSRRRLMANEDGSSSDGSGAVDFGLMRGPEDNENTPSLGTWAHLLRSFKSHGDAGDEPEEEFGLVNDLLMGHLMRQGQTNRELYEFVMEFDSDFEDDDATLVVPGQGNEDEVMDLDRPLAQDEEDDGEDSGDWYEEIMTDLRKETIDKVDWALVEEEIKDNLGDVWEQGRDYIVANTRRNIGKTLRELRLRLKDVLRRPMVVPTFGQYVWASKLLSSFFNVRRNLPRALRDSNYGRQWGNLLTLGTIHLSPREHPMTERFMDYLRRTYPAAEANVLFRMHDDEDAAMEYVMSHLDEERTWAVIDLSLLNDSNDEHNADKGGSFTIRLNSTTVPNTALVENYVASGLSTRYQRYFLSGYLTLQRTLNEFVMSESGCHAANTMDPFYTMPMPTAAYDQNIFFLHVGYLLGLVLTMAFLYPTSRLIQSLVEERETRMKETLLILGVHPWAHTTSWVATSAMSFVFITFFMTVVLRHIMVHTSFALIWFWLATFGMASMAFCFFLASFFSKAKLAAVIGPMALFASLLPRFVFFGTNRYEAIGAKYAASILPGTALAFGADIVGDYEYGEQSVGDHFWSGDYSFGTSIFFLIFDTVFYMVLAWYTEQVIPREYGAAAKPWYFPVMWCFPRYFSSYKTVAGSDDDDSLAKTGKGEEGECVEAVTDPALIPRVFINDLVKKYNNKAAKPAVNHLNLTLYESQITALLGHNGAGKTSTVSILTGLYPPTSGDVSIYGHSVVDELAKARHSIGICPQHDVLFDRLTVMEHLRFFSKIKGMSFDDRVLRAKALELGLTEDQLRTTAAALSGGNKRKLSVAIALCGDPKFLILDEPTSAMDPTARRRCWEVLRRKRQGRVTLLTTHFMDEAEHLSDRVAVVKEGELQCCGTPLYLKDKYNLGWNLTVVMEKPEESDGVENEYAGCQNRITSFLQQYVPLAELVRRSGRELTFCLPKGSEDLFPEAFDAFEEKSKDLGVSSYGVENASFEEVFLLLAEKDGNESNEKTDDVSVAETGSVSTDNASRAVLDSDSESVASSKVTAESGDTSDSGSDSESVAAVDPKVSPLDFKDTVNYQSMSAFRQIGLLYWKRFTVQKRDIKGAFFAIVVPVILVALVVLVLTIQIVVAGPPRALSPALYEKSYTSSSTGSANTQVLVGGGATARDPTDVQTQYLFMDAGLKHEYPNAQFTRLAQIQSSAELSDYLLETYNDHDRPVRFGAYSLDDAVQVNINVNFTAFQEQIEYYKNRTAYGAAKLRNQRFDLLEVMGVAGVNGRFYWRKSVADLADEFYSLTSMDPKIQVRTEDLHKLTQQALSGIMASSNKDLAETRAEYEQGIRTFVDELYNTTLSFLKSRRFRQLQSNVSQLVSDYGNQMAYVFEQTEDIEQQLSDMIQDFVKSTFEKLPSERVRNQKRAIYRWQGNMDNLVGDMVKDLKVLGESTDEGIPSFYNVTMKFVEDAKRLANQTVEEVSSGNYSYESIEDTIYDVFHGIVDDQFDREIILREISTMVNGISKLYNLGDADTTEAIKSAVNWIDDRLNDYSDGAIQGIPSQVFVAPLIFVDYVLGKYNVSTISPEEAFGYLSKSLGGSRQKLNGFISVRAKDITVDLGKLAIDFNNIYITTGHGAYEIDREIPFSFSLDALQDLVPGKISNLQFQFETYAKTSLMHNSSSPHAVAAFHQAYMEHEYKKCIGDNSGSARLVSVNHPLPLTVRQSLELKVMLSVLAGLFILIPFCYIPATFIVFLVRERVSKSKHLQLVSGVSLSAYWLATYLWDLTLYLCLTLCIMIVFLLYGDDAAVFVGDKDAFLCTFALTFGYGVSALPFAYLLSRMFHNSSTAQISVAGIGWLTGFVTVIGYVTMDSMLKTQKYAQAMEPWFRLFPAYNVGQGLMKMSISFWYREILGWEQYPLDWDVAGQSIFNVYLLALPYFFLVLVLEYTDDGGSGGWLGRGLRGIEYAFTRLRLSWYGISMSGNGADDAQDSPGGDDMESARLGDDSDVVQERQYVLKNSEELRQTAPVVLVNLWKIYPPSVGVLGTCMQKIRGFFAAICCFCCRAGPLDESENEKPFVPKQAVRGVSTVIKKGETYALLGANGAGKTTTMGMLTGDITSTNGSAYIAGHNATGGSTNGVSEARKNIGFCPQKDPLLDLMTGRETLTMFAKLRGIPSNEVDSLVQDLLDRLTLTPHADKVTKAYSGGNKRKLSLGLALIGDPKVLLIDESSSGLDPLAKRRMWDLIEEAARSRSVILTTHSMQEAEALCTRVAIMVKGKYVCLGSPQHLKNKYMDGYSVDIFCKSTASDAVVNAVENEVLYALPGCRVAERHGRFMRFEVSNVSCLGLGTCFRRLQELKNNPDLHVENYAVSQCSLEHVFVKLVNNDGENKEGDMENSSSFTKASF